METSPTIVRSTQASCTEPLVQRSVTLAADLNGDGVVNILDIRIVARAFGSRFEDPSWSSVADLDKNGVVNILDVTRVAKDFGRTADP